jgi:opacity protein-like surface antigen
VNPTVTVNLASLPTSLDFNASLLEATGGVHYQVPLPYAKILPFVGGGIGLARTKLAVEDSTFNILDLNFSEHHFTFNFGGGARVYFSPSWGVRPEIKLVHIPDETFFRTSVGLFYQFGK